MKKLIHLPALFILFFVACEKAVEVQSPGPAVFEATVMNDSIYSADSAEVVMLHKRHWKYVNYNFGADSLLSVSFPGQEKTRDLLKYRQDSIIIIAYGDFLAGEAFALTMQGFPYQGLAKFEESMDWDLGHNIDNGLSLSMTSIGIASIYEILGDYEKMLAYLWKGNYYAHQAFKGWHYGFSNNQYNIANTFFAMGSMERGIIEARKALDMTEVKDPFRHLRFSLWLANIYLDMERADEAAVLLNKFGRAIIEKRSHPDYFILKDRLSDYYLLVGRLSLQQKNYEQASRYFDEAIALSLQAPEYRYFEAGGVRAAVFQMRGRLFRAKEQPEEAIDAYKEAHKLALKFESSLHSLDFAIRINAELGNYFLELGRYEEGLETTQKTLHLLFESLDVSDYHQNPPLEQIAVHIHALPLVQLKARALHLLGLQNGDISLSKQALDVYQLGLHSLEMAQLRFQNPLSKRLVQEKSAPLTEGALEVAFTLENKKRPEVLFDLIQRKKAGTLLSRIKEVKVKSFSNIPPELKEREQDLQNEISYYFRMSTQEEHKPAGQRDSVKLAQWWSYQLDAQLALDSVHEALQKNFPKYQELQQPIGLVSIPELQKYLAREKAVLLDYFLGDSTLVIFGVNEEQPFVHYQIAGTGLKEQIDAFRKMNRSPDVGPKAFSELAQRLYAQLLEPVSQYLTQPNLIIIPDGQLGYLPFHLLMADEKGANFRDMPYLFRRYAIRYEYASSLLLQNWDRPKPKHTYAGFAPEYQGDELTYMRSAEDSLLLSSLYDEKLLREGLGPLQSNQEEVAFAAGTMNGLHYEGPDALESSFKAVAPGSRILHLAMHALTNDKEPIYSQLVFSREPDTLEDGKLHAYELYNMHLDADLAVLSACETGAGKVQSGEGVMSLSHAFKYAGCPNIVMSLWQAHDRSTSKLVTGFFQHLKKGEGKADALRKSCLDYLASADERYTHPFYWGGMVLIGDNESLGAGWGLTHSLIAGLLIGVVGWLGIWGRRVFRKKSALQA